MKPLFTIGSEVVMDGDNWTVAKYVKRSGEWSITFTNKGKKRTMSLKNVELWFEV